MELGKLTLPAPPREVKTVAVVGLGLLGASLGLCLRRHCPGLRILGWARRKETIREALEHGMIDAGSTDPAKVLPNADLTVICIPIQATIDFACQYSELWRSGAVVTDVGSVKSSVVNGIRGKLRRSGIHFVGSHPMAGTENSGLENAKCDLYDGAVVFVTDLPDDAAEAVQLVCSFWQSLGMEPHRLAPEPHDMLVARTSHVLHLLSFAAAEAYLCKEKAELATGGGFRDFTRIAASSPEMWVEIFKQNQEHVLAALEEFMSEVRDLRAAVSEGKWEALSDYLGEARDRRRAWYEQWQKRHGESL